MPTYEYQALTPEGKVARGVVTADTPRDARDKLRTQNIYPTSLDEVKAKIKKGFLGLSLLGKVFKRRREFEIITLTRHLATLLSSGVALADALRIIIEQIEHEDLEKIFRDIHEQVTAGVPLADALAQHSFYFNDLYVNMIRSGEASGSLDLTLRRLSEYMNKAYRLKSKITTATTYPVIVIFIGVMVVVFLLTFIVPQIISVLREQKVTLPTPTLILLYLSDFFRYFWWLILAVILAGGIAATFFLQTAKGKSFRDRFLLKLPLIGDLFKKSAISRFAMTLATLLKSGLPVVESLRIVSRAAGNTVLARELEAASDSIINGSDISVSLKDSKIFPVAIGHMIAVGEKSGQLEDVLERIAVDYDEEIEISAQRLVAFIEPAMIVCLAVVVTFIVLSIIIPIIEMSDIIQ
ncbi:MAG: type II secretion system F family protein [Planctomycetes bacterium]|nr:type II secretion system F family protein [Planctomycetota bacterium]